MPRWPIAEISPWRRTCRRQVSGDWSSAFKNANERPFKRWTHRAPFNWVNCFRSDWVLHCRCIWGIRKRCPRLNSTRYRQTLKWLNSKGCQRKGRTTPSLSTNSNPSTSRILKSTPSSVLGGREIAIAAAEALMLADEVDWEKMTGAKTARVQT